MWYETRHQPIGLKAIPRHSPFGGHQGETLAHACASRRHVLGEPQEFSREHPVFLDRQPDSLGTSSWVSPHTSYPRGSSQVLPTVSQP